MENIQELAKAIAEALAPHLTPVDPNQLYDHTDMARIFKVSRSTIYRRAKEENWPRIRVGNVDRFSQQDIEAIRAMYHQEPKQKVTPTVGTRARRRNNK